MASKWKKVKEALSSNLCIYVPTSSSDDDIPPPSQRFSGAGLLSSPATDWSLGSALLTSPRFRFSKSLTRSSKKICTICLASVKRGEGQAIFTAECSHSFHFQCIASNVKHGNHICPVCRAKWKEVPLLGPTLNLAQGRARINPTNCPTDNLSIRKLPPPRPDSHRHISPMLQPPEPTVFSDDEPLGLLSNKNVFDNAPQRKMLIKMYPEVPAFSRLSMSDDFTVLIHLKAPVSSLGLNNSKSPTTLTQVTQTRAPVDLVTVLDISGSMAGTKLALLKRAMGFVIQNLGPCDRLSVVAFSSNARRLFPLRRMTDVGKQQSLQAVNSLVANGGTNIAEGLRKGAKIMEDRKEKNPVSSIILLSDGQDTYTVSASADGKGQPNYKLLLPLSSHSAESLGSKIPVHAFGFGTDHDASSMHSISEISGGTFSFIETEGVIQDAFAQCIGGLLSVVVKGMRVIIESSHPKICLGSIKAGSYTNQMTPSGRTGFIDVGDLYADEERDFLVSINVPAEMSSKEETSLLKVKCTYNDPLTKEMLTLESEEVRIRRPEIAGNEMISIEVDRQRNRVEAAESMVKARTLAEGGDLSSAARILENCRKKLSQTVSAKSNDGLCIALDAELKEMQERMTTRHVYEASGRAYILSGMSSHSWQRATARGDSTGGSSLNQSYQTPSMVEMLTRSQATLLGSPSVQKLVRPIRSLTQPKPR